MWDTASKVQLQKLELVNAKPTLLSLIQAPSKQKNIRLITTRQENRILPKGLPLNLRKLEKIALVNRPELRQEIYQKRITLNDITQAKIKLLPNPSLGYGGYYDSNSFFVNNNWLIGTLNVAWDLLTIPNKLKNIKIAGQKAQIADLRRLGLAMAIITQVDIAKTALDAAKDLNYYRSKIYQSDKDIYEILKNKKETDFASQVAVSKAYINMVHSKLNRDKAYADYQIAAAILLESIGFDVVANINNLERPVSTIIDEIVKRADNLKFKRKAIKHNA